MGDVGKIGAAAIESGTDAAISAATNATNWKINKDTNNTSRDIASANNATQVALNSENNQFSHDEAALAYQRQIEQWQRQAKYDSPIEQLKRFQEAGLNPSVAFGGNLAQAASSAPNVAAASPHGSGVSLSMPNLIPFTAQAPTFGKDMIEAIAALSNADKSSAEAKQINVLMDDTARLLQEDIRGKRIANNIQEAYGMQTASAEVQKIVSEVAVNSKRCMELASQENLNDALAEAAKAKKAADEAAARLHGQQAELVKKQNDTFFKSLDYELRESASRTAANYGAANESNALAATENAVREAKVKIFGADADLKYIDAQVEKALFKGNWQYTDRINTILYNKTAKEKGILDYKQAEAIYPLALKMAEYDMKRGNMKDWYYYVDRALGVLSGAMVGTGAAYMHGAASKPTPIKGFKP